MAVESACTWHPTEVGEDHPLMPTVIETQQQAAFTPARAPGQPATAAPIDLALLAIMQKTHEPVSGLKSSMDSLDQEQTGKEAMSESPLPSRIDHAGLPTGLYHDQDRQGVA